MLNFTIWTVKPQIFDLGFFELRYYTLFFVLTFIIGYYMMAKFFKHKGIKIELLDKLAVYVIIGTILGARLGHCLFYEFSYYIKHPLEMILPFAWSKETGFEITGYQGLASHGGTIGILLAVYFYARKTKTSYLWTVDKLAILAALAGFFIRSGNLMNSEIYGNPGNNGKGFVFAHDFTNLIKKDPNVESVHFLKLTETKDSIKSNLVPLQVNIEFSRKVKDTTYAIQFASNQLKYFLGRSTIRENITHDNTSKLEYSIVKKDRHLLLQAKVYGVPRYPTQIYEAFIYLFIFFILIYFYYKKDAKLKVGFYLGLMFVLLFSSRFIIEYWKADQESFENGMFMNMGQLLSLPFIIIGLILIFRKTPEKKIEK